MIRLFEYDAQIALDEGEVTEETMTVAFPNTAVMYLRAYKKTPDKMKYVIATPGGTVQYDKFGKRTIIELSGDVIHELAQKYENVQKGIGDMMGGALIETEARRILKKGMNDANRETALKLLKRGKQTVEEIAEDTGLSVPEVKQLAGLQTV